MVEDARLVLGAVHMAPVEATEAETFLRGRSLDPETIEQAASLAAKPAKPLDNADLVYAWRKRMARIEVARALRELAGVADRRSAQRRSEPGRYSARGRLPGTASRTSATSSVTSVMARPR